MEEDSTTHPDEGTIHAWLDDALDAATAAGIAEHVRTCSACAERVAEARGLIAGASRIVASLDDLPTGARAGWAQSAPASGAAASPAAETGRQEGSLWRWLHVTPARAAIAATILVALGITMTRTRTGPDDVGVAARSGALSPQVATMSDSASPAEASAPAAERDALLDSALKKNLAMSQPPRAMDAVRGPQIPTPEPGAPAIGLAGVDTTASSRVAIARQEVAAEREVRADVADKARVRGAVTAASAPVVASAELSKQERADASSSGMGYTGAVVTPKSAVGVAIQCYRIESPTGGAAWGGQTFPLVISADSAARAGLTPARVLDAAGRPTSISAQFLRGAGDSITLRLRRIGYSGSIALGPDVGGRAGLAFSDPVASQLEQTVVTGMSDQRRDASASTSGARKAAGAAANVAPAEPNTAARSASPAPAPVVASPSRGAGTRVTMRVVGCPAA